MFCHCQKESRGTFRELKVDLFCLLFSLRFWCKHRFIWNQVLGETFFSYYKNTIKLFANEECVHCTSIWEAEPTGGKKNFKSCRGSDASPSLKWFLSLLCHLLCRGNQMELKFHLLDFFLLFRFFEQVDQIGEPPAGVRSHESTPPLRTFHVRIWKLLLHVRE